MAASGSPRREVQGLKTAMDVGEKSDCVVVPEKSPNRAKGRGGDGGTYSLPPVVTPIGSRDKGGARDVSETASATLRKAESSIRQRRYVS